MLVKQNYIMTGFSLLEVLVAMLIISSSLLGIFGLQNLALRHTQSAYYQTIAVNQAQALMERLRADSSSEGQRQEMILEQNLIANWLPQGHCDYQCLGAPPACAVNVYWQDHGSQHFTINSLL